MKSIGIVKDIKIDELLFYIKEIASAEKATKEYGRLCEKASKVALMAVENLPMSSYDKNKKHYNVKKSMMAVYTGKGTMEYMCDYFIKHIEYTKEYGQDITYSYKDEEDIYIELPKYGFLIPASFVKAVPFKDYSDIPLSQLRLKGGMGVELPLALSDDVTENVMKDRLKNEEVRLESALKEIEDKKKEKEAKIEEMKRQIELKYAGALAELQKKAEELELQKKRLEGEIFLLDTEIYGIRCFFGETVNFTKLVSGKNEDVNEPVVLHQKVRFLDEEMAKYVSLYDFDETDCDQFEKLIQSREDMRNLFFAEGKSISLIRISRDGKQYASGRDYHADSKGNVFVRNVMNIYETYHGTKMAILIRNGENCYIGWTELERVNIADGNAFLNPQEQYVEQIEEECDWKGDKFVKTKSTEKEEVASRYFIFSILQGVILNSKLIELPQDVDIFHNASNYVIYSLADTWITDNRFGTLTDILERTSDNLYMKGDYILTTQSLRAEGRYERYNNDRGRGYANRTHDVYARDNTIYPVNLVDNIPCKKIYYESKQKVGTGIYRAKTEQKWKKEYDFCDTWEEFLKHRNTEDYEFRLLEIKDSAKQNIFVSLEKTKNWCTGKASRANFQLFTDEYINLTFLNTVYLKYIIVNRQIGNGRFGKNIVNFSYMIPYLNHAMDFLKEREKMEYDLIRKELKHIPDEWQVKLSEWKMEQNVHMMTAYQAKRFVKWLLLNRH